MSQPHSVQLPDLAVLPLTLAIGKLISTTDLPSGMPGGFWAVVKTRAELSLVCEEQHMPAGAQSVERGYACLEVQGPLDFALTGIISGIASVLAGAGISIFPIATYDTDYVLLKSEQLSQAVHALTQAGYFCKA